MRSVEVRCKWESVHTIEVPEDTPKIESDDLNTLLDVSGDDVQNNVAELVDWKITDRGPKDNLR
jgi:hypothetical protein